MRASGVREWAVLCAIIALCMNGGCDDKPVDSGDALRTRWVTRWFTNTSICVFYRSDDGKQYPPEAEACIDYVRDEMRGLYEDVVVKYSSSGDSYWLVACAGIEQSEFRLNGEPAAVIMEPGLIQFYTLSGEIDDVEPNPNSIREHGVLVNEQAIPEYYIEAR